MNFLLSNKHGDINLVKNVTKIISQTEIILVQISVLRMAVWLSSVI